MTIHELQAIFESKILLVVKLPMDKSISGQYKDAKANLYWAIFYYGHLTGKGL